MVAFLHWVEKHFLFYIEKPIILCYNAYKKGGWVYERKLQYPINITRPNPAMAKFIMSQYGGPYCYNL